MWGMSFLGNAIYSGQALEGTCVICTPPGTCETTDKTHFCGPRGPEVRRNNVTITVVKRNGDREPYDANKINLARGARRFDHLGNPNCQ